MINATINLIEVIPNKLILKRSQKIPTKKRIKKIEIVILPVSSIANDPGS